MSTLLVDGDIIAYKAATIAERPVNWGDGLWTLHAYEQDVANSCDQQILKLLEESGCDKIITCVSGKKNYRTEVAPYYKMNRAETRKPMLLGYARGYLMDKWEGQMTDGIEADDLLGILGSADPEENIIWSADKDLKTIPARHLIDGEVVTIDEEEANYWFFLQTLMGDTTDGYKGCPTVGAKKADAILQEDCTWEAVVATFKKKGFSEELALENARLARILRTGEYNFDTGEVKLWLQ